MPKPTSFVKFTSGSISEPGEFIFTKTLKVGENRDDYYKGKIIIIVNAKTQSNAEYTTMALRVAPKATVIGSTTAGADGNVSKIILPGNIRTMISGIGVYYPDRTETQRVGIVPDIEINPTIEEIRNGTDGLLNKAIKLINRKIGITCKSTGRLNVSGICVVLKFYENKNIAVQHCTNKLNCCNRLVIRNLQTGC